MSLLPRCICDPLDAMVGRYDRRCSRHYEVNRGRVEEIQLTDEQRKLLTVTRDVSIPGAFSDEDHALTVAYMKGRGDERAACTKAIQECVKRWDGPWQRAGQWLAAMIGQQAMAGKVEDIPPEARQ